MSIKKWCSQWISGSIDKIEFSEIINGHNSPFLLPENVRQATLASIVGDGYMSLGNKRSKYPRITWNMGSKSHAEYKRNFFSQFGARLVEGENPGWGSRWYQVSTKSCLAFLDIHNNYNHRCKEERAGCVIPELREVGWAWLYGDDGHLDINTEIAYIHTEGLGEGGTTIASKSLANFIGSDRPVSIHKYIGGTPKKTRFCLRLKKNETVEFISRISSHMANGMEYKKLAN